MEVFEAIVLGIIQGLTEFLPVSSSGHLEIGKYLFEIVAESSFAFSVAVHGATVLSTIVVFWQEKIMVSMIPVIVVGFTLKDTVESFFDGDINFVGAMLIVTSVLLFASSFVKRSHRNISYLDSFIIGVAQAFAVLPGISRSGATISTGLVLGNSPEKIARFSFLMVLIPILGANIVEILGGEFSGSGDIKMLSLIAGSLAAFISGYIACRWMISIVQKGKLYWFGIYCMGLGLLIIFLA